MGRGPQAYGIHALSWDCALVMFEVEWKCLFSDLSYISILTAAASSLAIWSFIFCLSTGNGMLTLPYWNKPYTCYFACHILYCKMISSTNILEDLEPGQVNGYARYTAVNDSVVHKRLLNTRHIAWPRIQLRLCSWGLPDSKNIHERSLTNLHNCKYWFSLHNWHIWRIC